uniref:Uncharacterized protein n=1 Tax=Avena sativa TaxID=4498 RepID=A0ACD5TX21_AVESA
MKPSELRFDRLSIWVRVVNLPFHLRDQKWWKPIAQQIDKQAKDIHFDHAGGYLRARVSVEVSSPLRRWVLIESARRQSTNLYDIQYEHAPHFCFSCGRFGHGDLMCPTPGTRDANGILPFGKNLRAPDEWKKTDYSEGSSGGVGSFSKSHRADSWDSSCATEAGPEATSPLKKSNAIKRKAGAQNQVYRKIVPPVLQITDGTVGVEGSVVASKEVLPLGAAVTGLEDGENNERDSKKKKATPSNSDSAVAASQPCLEK